MQFKLILLSVLLLLSPLTIAEEKADCGLAIDEADKIVPDPKSDCDHTQTGLNGVFHRALSNDEAKNEKHLNKDTDQKNEMPKEKPTLVFASEFNNAQDLQSLKFSLLAKIALECPKGFTLDAERYIPSENKNLKLELLYRCF